MARGPFPAPAALGKVILELPLGFSPTLPPPFWTPGRTGCLRVPAWGAEKRGQTHLRGGTALGTSIPAGLSPRGLNTVVAPGSPGCQCGSGWFGADHFLLSVFAVASSCVVPSVPGGKVALGHLDPLSPCSTLALCPSHLKSGGIHGLTGWSGMWKSSGIPSDTELSEPLVLQEERTICSPRWHHGVTRGDMG